MSFETRGWSSGFGRSVVFAVLAALAYPFWMLLAHPAFGGGFAISLFLVGATVLYVAGCGLGWRKGLLPGFVAAFLGLLVLAVAERAGEVAIGCALILGLCRSGLIWRARPARALAVEATLLLFGLLLARFLITPNPLGGAPAIWGFLLVQSLFFLVPGAMPRANKAPDLDAFELARARALALLEDDVG